MEVLWDKTNREADSFLLNNEILSDVKFVFPNCENKEIYGHTFLLSKKSSVFYNMFNGSIKELDTVEIVDSSDKSFLELLKYIYTEIVDLTGANVLELQYLANKYFIKNLQEKCVKFIEENTDKVLSRQNTDIEMVKHILTLDKVNCNEIRIFNLILIWAESFCSKNDEELSSLRELFRLIRFPTMKAVEFGECIKEYSDLFTTEEIGEIFLYISTTNFSKCLDLKTEKRTLTNITESIEIESQYNTNMRWIDTQLKDPGFIVVKPLKNCFLSGFSLYKGGGRLKLYITIVDETNNQNVYYSYCNTSFGFNFKEEIYFEKDTTYKIQFVNDTADTYYAFTPLYKTYDSSNVKNLLTITSSYHNIIQRIYLKVQDYQN